MEKEHQPEPDSALLILLEILRQALKKEDLQRIELKLDLQLRKKVKSKVGHGL